MNKSCEKCKKPFVDKDEWRKLCMVCWKKDKGFDLTKSDDALAALQDYTKTLEKDTAKLEKDLEKAEKKIKKLEGKKGTVVEENEENSENTNLTEVQIKALLRLCHPDRHANNKLSNEITKWLLQLREVITEK